MVNETPLSMAGFLMLVSMEVVSLSLSEVSKIVYG